MLTPLAGTIAATMTVFAALATAQIPGLCNTGQTQVNSSGCTGTLVTPNPEGGGPDRDGNWYLAYPYPSTLPASLNPCGLTGYVKAWVDTPEVLWLSNGASTSSEWITPYDGESPDNPPGWYVYRTAFRVPLLLPGGATPAGFTINGRVASDNSTYGFYLASPAKRGSCAFVSGLPIPINRSNSNNFTGFESWTDFSFTIGITPGGITPGSEVFLYAVVQNYDVPNSTAPSQAGFRIEFLDSSAFF